MSWFTETLATSIGKKLLMALTGLGFCLFLVGHLVGNTTIYVGSEAFNAYAAHLHEYEPLIRVMEMGLLLFALIHVITGTILFFQNFGARPNRYSVNRRAGGRSIGSATMPYTGFLVLCFVILHLADFHFVDKSGTTIWNIVADTFQNPLYILTYIIAMVIVAIHISHGFWSAFQTIGANHPKYMPFIMGLGIAFSVAVGIVFGFIPIFLSTTV